MEIDEALSRLVRRHRVLLVVCLVVPLLFVMGTTGRAPRYFESQARILVSGTVATSSVQADAQIAQARALATSATVVGQALGDAHVDGRSAADIAAHRVTVTGLGTSPIAAIAVDDRDRTVAQRITQALSNRVVNLINSSSDGGSATVLQAIDDQLAQLAEKRVPLASQLAAHPTDDVAKSRLAGIDRLISDLSGDRTQLTIDAATRNHATVVDQASLPAHRQPSSLTQHLVLGGVLGLVLWLCLAGILEAVRPSVPDGRRLSQLVEAPFIGRLPSRRRRHQHEGWDEGARRLALAATNAGVRTVALVGPASLAERRRLAAALSETLGRGNLTGEAVPARHAAGIPLPTGGGSGPGGAVGGLLPADSEPGSPPVDVSVLVVEEAALGQDATRVGLMVVAPEGVAQKRVEEVQDLVTVSGWPVLGVLTVARRSWLRGGRRAS